MLFLGLFNGEVVFFNLKFLMFLSLAFFVTTAILDYLCTLKKRQYYGGYKTR